MDKRFIFYSRIFHNNNPHNVNVTTTPPAWQPHLVESVDFMPNWFESHRAEKARPPSWWPEINFTKRSHRYFFFILTLIVLGGGKNTTAH